MCLDIIKQYRAIRIHLINHFGTNETRTIETNNERSFHKYFTIGLNSNQIQVFNIYCVNHQSIITNQKSGFFKLYFKNFSRK